MKCSRVFLYGVVLLVLFSSSTAFAWGPITHGKMATNALNHSSITPYLAAYGLSASTIAGMAYELDLSAWKDTYHHPAWETIRDRLWLTDPKWAALDESRRLAFLCHIASDAGVPMSHSPANNVWTNTTLEATLEARVETWGSFASVTPYTGATYTDKMNTFYSQEIALATYAKNNLKWYNVLGSVGQTCGWTGVTYGQNLTVTMLQEYFATRPSSMMAIPEPATMSLLAVGAVALLRRRKK